MAFQFTGQCSSQLNHTGQGVPTVLLHAYFPESREKMGPGFQKLFRAGSSVRANTRTLWAGTGKSGVPVVEAGPGAGDLPRWPPSRPAHPLQGSFPGACRHCTPTEDNGLLCRVTSSLVLSDNKGPHSQTWLFSTVEASPVVSDPPTVLRGSLS